MNIILHHNIRLQYTAPNGPTTSGTTSKSVANATWCGDDMIPLTPSRPFKDPSATVPISFPLTPTAHPVFNPTVNLDFNSGDEDDSDYDPFAGLSNGKFNDLIYMCN